MQVVADVVVIPALSECKFTADTASNCDFFFDVAATDVASSDYVVFASVASYFDAVNVDSPLVHRLTLSDFDFTGASVEAVNDRVATVVIETAGGFLGDLSLAVDTAGLILDTPDTAPTPVQGLSQIIADTTVAGDFDIVAVPEPSSLAIVFAGLGALCALRKTRHSL